MISRYVDDVLTRDEKRSFNAHVDGCEACRKELEETEEVRLLLANAGRFEAPPGFAQRVMGASTKGKNGSSPASSVFFPANPSFCGP